MNQFGVASQGKLTEMKNVAESFLGGHGSAYVAQVSMANTAQFLASQDNTVQRHVLDPCHVAYVPDFGVYIEIDNGDGTSKIVTLSRQMVLFCVERRKAWRMLQSRAGVVNDDYAVQQAVRAALAAEESVPDRFAFARERLAQELVAVGAAG